MQPILEHLFQTHARCGRLDWIGIRPARDAPMQELEVVELRLGEGVVGDHYQGVRGVREVTLIQAEHLAVVSALLGKPIVASQLRRNLLVSGINIGTFVKRRFRIGDTELEGTGLCHPCSKMERVLGVGGFNAMRGHGGITARVRVAGTLRCGDGVQLA